MSDKCLDAALRSIGVNRKWTPATEYHGDRPCLPIQAWHRIAHWSQWEQKSRRSRYNFWFEQFKRSWEPAPYWSFLEMPKLVHPYRFK
jgi:hypothetical protein